jgi:hypothetical protein
MVCTYGWRRIWESSIPGDGTHNMARWVPTAHILCLWFVHSIVPWFSCSVMYHLLNTTNVFCRMSMRPSTSHNCLAVNSCFHHSWLTFLQNLRFLVTILILNFKPVYQNQFSTHKLEPCWQSRWRCTGVIMVAMMIRMRAWAIPKNGHHVWTTKLSIK